MQEVVITLEGILDNKPSREAVLRNWHRFSVTGALFLLDVISGSLHELDRASYRAFDVLEADDRKAALVSFQEEFGVTEMDEVIEDINILIHDGNLTYAEEEELVLNLPEERNIKAMCLHAAHDCNMRCGYCFAGTGGFGGERSLMSADIGKKALDFLFESSGHIKHLEVDFFGGEPLLNMEAVSDIVSYGKELEKIHGKYLKFTMTTNALSLSKEIGKFLNENDISTVLSIDGRKEVHDAVRKTVSGDDTFEPILNNCKEFVTSRQGEDYYVRGTYTKKNLDFSKDVLTLAGEGFKRISFEPVVAKEGSPYAINKSDLDALSNEYDVLVTKMLEKCKAGEEFNFFHFDMEVAKGPCLAKRLSGCGAGAEYVAVTPDGDIYPCHQFVGDTKFKLGDVWSGIDNKEVRANFSNANIYTKENCRSCWTRFYCSGGCHANAFQFNEDILKPYELGCEITQKRIEAALAYQALKK